MIIVLSIMKVKLSLKNYVILEVDLKTMILNIEPNFQVQADMILLYQLIANKLGIKDINLK